VTFKIDENLPEAAAALLRERVVSTHTPSTTKDFLARMTT
jgi:hypothetical protein